MRLNLQTGEREAKLMDDADDTSNGSNNDKGNKAC